MPDLTECLGASQYGTDHPVWSLVCTWEKTSRACQVLSLFSALQWLFNWNCSYNSSFCGNSWQYLFTCAELCSCDPLQVVHSFCWHPSHLSGSAAHQAVQACAVVFSQGTGVNCLPSSQGTANGNELTCASAILHLEPWTLVLPFFISVSQTSMVLFQGASVCQTAAVWIVYPHCSAKRNWEILAVLHQPGNGRCSPSDPKWEQGLCLEEWHVCARKKFPYTCPSTKLSLTLSQDNDYVWAEIRERKQSFTRAEVILDSPEQTWRLTLH